MFIPFIIQVIFYDKILDRYSIHYYQLERISEDIEFKYSYKPQLQNSEEFIKREGI